MSNDTNEVTVALASLTFTSFNWNVVQDLVVSAVNDGIADGDQVATITVQIVSVYNELGAAPVTMPNGPSYGVESRQQRLQYGARRLRTRDSLSLRGHVAFKRWVDFMQTRCHEIEWPRK